MTDPTAAARWRFVDHGPLRSGRVYRVIRAFEDRDGVTHEAGEQLTYLSAVDETPGHTALWCRRAVDGALRPIRLPRHLPLDVHFDRVPIVPAEHTLYCACEPAVADWGEVYAADRLSVQLCFRCGLVLALEAKDEGFRITPLTEDDRLAVERVTRLPYDVKLDSLLEVALASNSYPANLMLGALLERRSNLERELGTALGATDPQLRRLALSFAAQLEPLPRAVEAELVQLLHAEPAELDDFDLELLLRALEAALPTAAAYRGRIEDLARRLKGSVTEAGMAARQTAGALLRRVEELNGEEAGRRTAAAAVLRTMAIRRDFSGAESWLLEMSGEQLPAGDPTLQRGLLCEAAGDRAREDATAARFLYSRALRYFSDYAASTDAHNDESTTRHRHSARAAQKLRALPRDTAVPPPR